MLTPSFAVKPVDRRIHVRALKALQLVYQANTNLKEKGNNISIKKE